MSRYWTIPAGDEPPRETSEAYALISNLRNAARHHTQHCKEPCSVSVGLLRQAAEKLVIDSWPVERSLIKAMLEEMPL